MSLSASFCVSARVSVSLCVFPRLSVCLSASLCVVFPRIHARLHVSLRCLSASLRVFPRPSASSPRVSQDIPASLCVCPRLYVSSFRFPLRRLSASPNVFARLSVSFREPVRHPPASLCMFQRLCASVVFPHLSLAFMISASCFYLSLPLSTYLRVGFPHLFEPFRSSQRRPSTSLSVVVCPIASLLRVSPRLSASLWIALRVTLPFVSFVLPFWLYFRSIFIHF